MNTYTKKCEALMGRDRVHVVVPDQVAQWAEAFSGRTFWAIHAGCRVRVRLTGEVMVDGVRRLVVRALRYERGGNSGK